MGKNESVFAPSLPLGNNGRFAEGGNAVCQRRMGAKKRSERAAPKKGLYDAQGRTRRRYSRRRNAIVDRKSTRLNSSHGYISYAVFCLKKKKTRYNIVIYSSKQIGNNIYSNY